MKTNVIIEIEVSKQPLLTDKDTGKQKIRLTLEEARELYAELPRLLNLAEKQPVPQAPQQPFDPNKKQWPGILPGPNRPNPYTPGPQAIPQKPAVRDPMPMERNDPYAYKEPEDPFTQIRRFNNRKDSAGSLVGHPMWPEVIEAMKQNRLADELAQEGQDDLKGTSANSDPALT